MSGVSPVRIPKYRHYRPKDLAVVRLNGRDFYLGAYGSPESRQKYDRLIAEWLASGRQPPESDSPGRAATQKTVDQVLLAFWRYAEAYYQKDGKPGKELTAYEYALQPVTDLYGLTPAANFGPLALKAVREHVIEQGICRGQVNARINRIKRVFKWAVSEELVPPSVYEGLRTVAGLRHGRSRARESEPVKPIASEIAESTCNYVSPQIAAMIRLQLLTGMRPGEVVIMRPCDIDRTQDVWEYTPSDHKTAYRGFQRRVPLGPRAQSLLLPFLDRPPEAFIFSPMEAEAWRNEERGRTRNPNRKTKVFPCELRARSRRQEKAKARRSKRPKRERFDVDSYRRAITYGIEKARRTGQHLPHWHPHQLRHTFATEIRKEYGIESAQVALGHAHADVTQVYAERNYERATQIALARG